MGCVYKLTFPSGREYVGITRHSVATRIKSHVKNASSRSRMLVGRALNKYWPDVNHVVLHKSDDWTVLQQLEREEIKHHDTLHPNGYNFTGGGEGVPNLCEKSEAKRRRNISKGLTGKTLTQEHRRNLSLSHIGLPGNRKGKKVTEETKLRMSRAAKKRWEVGREEIMSIRTTDEYKKALSEGVKRSWLNRR